MTWWKTVKIDGTGVVKTNLLQDFDTVGDGSGTTNMGVDGSTTPISFFIKPNAGEIIRINRLIISIRDSGSFDSGGWGNNGGSELINGIKMFTNYNGGGDIQLNGILHSHYELAAAMFDISHNSWGAGDEFLTARFSFNKFGEPIRLVGDDNDYIKILISDDLTHLVDQRIKAEGYYE